MWTRQVNKRSVASVCHANVLYKVRGMWERKLCKHTALYRTFTISKVNLNLQYFCFIEIWKSEVQGWNLSKIFGILTSGFGHNKITSNEPWNTETHKTDRNPPITNHKQWSFEPVEVNFCFLRGVLWWLASDILLTRGSKCTNHRKTVLIACFLRGHLNLLFSLFFCSLSFPYFVIGRFC